MIMKEWNAPEVTELNIKETANGPVDHIVEKMNPEGNFHCPSEKPDPDDPS